MSSRVRAVVFDLDGTLIDSAPDIAVVANTVLAANDRPPLSLAEVRSFVGSGVAAFVARMRAARDLPDHDQDRLLAVFTEGYLTAVDRTVFYPGARAALDHAKAQGFALGLCTNKPLRPTMAVLAHLQVAHLFGAVIAGDSLAVRKPDPEPLRATFAGLGTTEGLFVGDSGIDAETARAAGVPFALYTEGYRAEPVADLPHDWAFSDFAAFPGILEEAFSQPA